jgi:hypothetical protein
MILFFSFISCNIETTKETKVITSDTIYICDRAVITDEGQLLLYKGNNIKWIIKTDKYTIEQ